VPIVPSGDDADHTDQIQTPGQVDPAQTALRGGVLRIGGYFIGILVATFSSALFFRHLGVLKTGEYVTALSLVAIVAGVSDLGLTAVGIREISTRPPSERWSLASDLLGLKLTLTAIGGVIVTTITWFAYSTTLAAGVALAVVGLGLSATQDNFAIALVVDLRLGWVAALDLMRNLLTAACTIALVLLDAELVPFLGISIPVCAATTFATIILVRNGRSLAPRFNLRRWRQFAATVLPYSAAVAASTLYYRVSILLVSAISNGHQLGYFSVSYRVIEVLTVVPTLLVSSAFPILARAARSDHARFTYAIRKVFELSFIVGAFIAVSTAVAAPIAIDIIGGPQFRPAGVVLAFGGLGLGAMFINAVWSYGLLSLGEFKAILRINTSALIFNAILVAPLVEIAGARGAAIGTSITEVLVAVVQGWAFTRTGHPVRTSLGIVPRVLLASGMALVPLALTAIPTLGRLVISVAVFTAIVALTHAIPREVYQFLPLDRFRHRTRRAGSPS